MCTSATSSTSALSAIRFLHQQNRTCHVSPDAALLVTYLLLVELSKDIRDLRQQ
jgi:hypothetical protein